MEKNDRQLDIEQLSRIVENVEPQSDVSVDDILAEYSNEVNNSNFLQHVAYLPDTDRYATC